MVIQHLFIFLRWSLCLLASPTEWQTQQLNLSPKMIVPDLTGLSTATKIVSASDDAAATVTQAPANLTELTRSSRKSGQANAILSVSTGIPRSSAGRKKSVKGLQDKQSCASGMQFYKCDNGSTGCCSVDPCDPDGGCPDGTTTTSASVTSEAKSTSTAQASTTETMSSTMTTAASSITTSGTQRDTSSLVTAVVTSNATSTATSTVNTASVTPAPSCPAGNGTTFTDSSKIDYKIHCNADNSYSSFNTIQVGTGGYGECFSSCSVTRNCAGFTFDGLDTGSCYLKASMPDSDYVAKNGSNYISCAKVNSTSAVPNASSTASPNSAKKSSAGAVAGGVIGGIAFLALILILIAWLARRRHQKIEERRATITHVIHGPIETQQMMDNSSSTGGHARSGSTAHDAFAPFGGSYYVPVHTRQRSIYQGQEGGTQQWV